MKVPNFETAVVPTTKLTDYLLSETHPDGKHKARFFKAFGFSLDIWQTLESALRQHISGHEVAKVEMSSLGTRYVVEGIMVVPDGRSPLVRTIWFVRNQEEIPQFVTAYPIRRRDND